MRALALVAAALLLAGCVKTVAPSRAEPLINPSAPLGAGVRRVVDPAFGVACYVAASGSISCVKVAGGAP